MAAKITRPRRSRLVTLVQRFVQADSWPASREFVERHAALVSDDADDILTGLRALASARGDSAAAHAFEVHQDVLRRYRKVGGAAFDDLIAPDVPAALRPQWVAAEAAYERYRARPSRAAADAAIRAIEPVLQHDGFAAVPAAARAGMDQASGTLLGERYQRHGGSAADLDAAVTCFTAAVHDMPDDAPDRPSYASALGNVLGMRFEERGDPADLDAAIQWSRVAAAGHAGRRAMVDPPQPIRQPGHSSRDAGRLQGPHRGTPDRGRGPGQRPAGLSAGSAGERPGYAAPRSLRTRRCHLRPDILHRHRAGGRFRRAASRAGRSPRPAGHGAPAARRTRELAG